MHVFKLLSKCNKCTHHGKAIPPILLSIATLNTMTLIIMTQHNNANNHNDTHNHYTLYNNTQHN